MIQVMLTSCRVCDSPLLDVAEGRRLCEAHTHLSEGEIATLLLEEDVALDVLDDDEEVCDWCGIKIVNGGESVDGETVCLDCWADTHPEEE